MRMRVIVAAVIAALAAGGGVAMDRWIIGGTPCVAVQQPASDPFADLEAKRRHDIDEVLRANPDR